MRHRNNGSGKITAGEGRYANYFEIGHNAVEFIIDFGQCYDDGEDAKMHTRIVTSPLYAKELAEILRESLSQCGEHLPPAQQKSAQSEWKQEAKVISPGQFPGEKRCLELRPKKSDVKA